MSLVAMLVRGLRVLFGTAGVLPALGVIALAMMLGGGTMFLGSVFVMFGSLVMFVSGHEIPRWLSAPSQDAPRTSSAFQSNPVLVQRSSATRNGNSQQERNQ